MNTPTPPRHSSATIPVTMARIRRTRRFRGVAAGAGGGTAGGGGGFVGCTRTRLVRPDHRSAVDEPRGARRVGRSARTGRIAHRLRNVGIQPVQGTVWARTRRGGGGVVA